MKIRISDIAGGCFPEKAEIGRPDPEMTARVKGKVFSRLATEEKRTGRKTLRTVLLVAAAALLLTTTALAAQSYYASVREPDPQESFAMLGQWYNAVSGRIETQTIIDADAKLVLTFSRPDTPTYLAHFRAGWLPSEPSMGEGERYDPEGWYRYLSDMGWEDKGYDYTGIPYVINCYSLGSYKNGFLGLLHGSAEILCNETKNGIQRIEICCDYSENDNIDYPEDRANYIFRISESDGYFLYIGGTSDMETLRHIEQELEIELTGTLAPLFEGTFTSLDVGRG